MNDSDIVHIVGDIVNVRRPFFTTCRYSIPQTDDTPPSQQAYITLSGIALNSNETDRCFEANAAQYTSLYKMNRVRAHLNTVLVARERKTCSGSIGQHWCLCRGGLESVENKFCWTWYYVSCSR